MQIRKLVEGGDTKAVERAVLETRDFLRANRIYGVGLRKLLGRHWAAGPPKEAMGALEVWGQLLDTQEGNTPLSHLDTDDPRLNAAPRPIGRAPIPSRLRCSS